MKSFLVSLWASLRELALRIRLKTPDFLRRVGNFLLAIAGLCFVFQEGVTSFFAQNRGYIPLPGNWIDFGLSLFGMLALGGKLGTMLFYDQTKLTPEQRAALERLKALRKNPEQAVPD